MVLSPHDSPAFAREGGRLAVTPKGAVPMTQGGHSCDEPRSPQHPLVAGWGGWGECGAGAGVSRGVRTGVGMAISAGVTAATGTALRGRRGRCGSCAPSPAHRSCGCGGRATAGQQRPRADTAGTGGSAPGPRRDKDRGGTAAAGGTGRGTGCGQAARPQPSLGARSRSPRAAALPVQPHAAPPGLCGHLSVTALSPSSLSQGSSVPPSLPQCPPVRPRLPQ